MSSHLTSPPLVSGDDWEHEEDFSDDDEAAVVDKEEKLEEDEEENRDAANKQNKVRGEGGGEGERNVIR